MLRYEYAVLTSRSHVLQQIWQLWMTHHEGRLRAQGIYHLDPENLEPQFRKLHASHAYLCTIDRASTLSLRPPLGLAMSCLDIQRQTHWRMPVLP